MAKILNVAIPNADRDVEKLDDLYIADGYIKWYSHSGKFFGSYLKHETCIYHVTLYLHSCIFIPE